MNKTKNKNIQGMYKKLKCYPTNKAAKEVIDPHKLSSGHIYEHVYEQGPMLTHKQIHAKQKYLQT